MKYCKTGRYCKQIFSPFSMVDKLIYLFFMTDKTEKPKDTPNINTMLMLGTRQAVFPSQNNATGNICRAHNSAPIHTEEKT